MALRRDVHVAPFAVVEERSRLGDQVVIFVPGADRINGEVTRIEGGVTFVRFDGREAQYAADELDALILPRGEEA